jgi:hypothetical protein
VIFSGIADNHDTQVMEHKHIGDCKITSQFSNWQNDERAMMLGQDKRLLVHKKTQYVFEHKKEAGKQPLFLRPPPTLSDLGVVGVEEIGNDANGRGTEILEEGARVSGRMNNTAARKINIRALQDELGMHNLAHHITQAVRLHLEKTGTRTNRIPDICDHDEITRFTGVKICYADMHKEGQWLWEFARATRNWQAHRPEGPTGLFDSVLICQDGNEGHDTYRIAWLLATFTVAWEPKPIELAAILRYKKVRNDVSRSDGIRSEPL